MQARMCNEATDPEQARNYLAITHKRLQLCDDYLNNSTQLKALDHQTRNALIVALRQRNINYLIKESVVKTRLFYYLWQLPQLGGREVLVAGQECLFF